MVAQLTPRPHPIIACATDITALLAGVAQIQPTYMSPEDKRAALLGLTAAQRMLEELWLRVIAGSGDMAEADGARDVAAWLAANTRAEADVTRADQHLATALDTRWERVRAGMAAGTVSPEQARVIAHGLDALPDRIGADVLARAEAQLVEWCEQFRPGELRRLARHILDVVAPEITEAEEAERLQAEEQSAREKTSLRVKRLGDGSSRTTIVHPDSDADRLLTYLDAFTSPRKSKDATCGEEDRIPQHRRRGHAFGALLEHLDPDKLPRHGGDATTVMVTISLDALKADLSSGGTVDGDPDAGSNLSASAIRRMACTANIVPVVLGGQGEILDLGRSRRIFQPPQRKAMLLRDKQCRAEGCTIPGRWCEAHHDQPWSEGGKTDLNHGRLYCSYHHHRAHDPRYTAEKLPNGDTRFYRRT